MRGLKPAMIGQHCQQTGVALLVSAWIETNVDKYYMKGYIVALLVSAWIET